MPVVNPAQILISLAIFVGGLVLGGWALHHAGYQAGVADSAVALNKEQDANAASQLAITGLRASVASCELNRILDQTAQSRAMAERQAQLERAEKVYKSARDALAQLMGGQCKEWAKQPACGSVP